MDFVTRLRALHSLGLAVGASLNRWRAFGQQPQLPLRTTGLEHIGMTVPDQETTAKFYGRIFDPQLFQERDPPPRFYTRLGISYIAFGGGNAANPGPPRIDHFCTVVDDYKPQDMRKALEDAGITIGTGPGGMASDPDGLRLQLLGFLEGWQRLLFPRRESAKTSRRSRRSASITSCSLCPISRNRPPIIGNFSAWKSRGPSGRSESGLRRQRRAWAWNLSRQGRRLPWTTFVSAWRVSTGRLLRKS
jgi:hypothetical protein